MNILMWMWTNENKEKQEMQIICKCYSINLYKLQIKVFRYRLEKSTLDKVMLRYKSDKLNSNKK